jgi:hypothetical protein
MVFWTWYSFLLSLHFYLSCFKFYSLFFCNLETLYALEILGIEKIKRRFIEEKAKSILWLLLLSYHLTQVFILIKHFLTVKKCIIIINLQCFRTFKNNYLKCSKIPIFSLKNTQAFSVISQSNTVHLNHGDLTVGPRAVYGHLFL